MKIPFEKLLEQVNEFGIQYVKRAEEKFIENNEANVTTDQIEAIHYTGGFTTSVLDINIF